MLLRAMAAYHQVRRNIIHRGRIGTGRIIIRICNYCKLAPLS